MRVAEPCGTLKYDDYLSNAAPDTPRAAPYTPRAGPGEPEVVIRNCDRRLERTALARYYR
ncbi:MAG: hypothetical protein C5B58_01465 [Acidobacteria bacterium]|nr:MAG: hypothetical protein C5B58_01465 [Acidobacteriota bacterium]